MQMPLPADRASRRNVIIRVSRIFKYYFYSRVRLQEADLRNTEAASSQGRRNAKVPSLLAHLIQNVKKKKRKNTVSCFPPRSANKKKKKHTNKKESCFWTTTSSSCCLFDRVALCGYENDISVAQQKKSDAPSRVEKKRRAAAFARLDGDGKKKEKKTAQRQAFIGNRL